MSPTPTPAIGLAHVVINEIAWAGTANYSGDEWIELYNTGSVAINLDGWALFENETRIITLTGSIAAGAYYLIERTDDTTISNIPANIHGSFGGSGLKNLPDGENLMLRDTGGVIIDSVPCFGGWFAGTDSTGNPSYASMERISAILPGADSSNWATNTGLITTGMDAGNPPQPLRGTPKFKNSVTP
ncbi:MAG: lamin tail domain-containing protein [Patescibacteria group bacterium]